VESESAPTEVEPKAGWFARTPLRVKLVAVMLALVSLALIVIGAASAVALRSYLVDRHVKARVEIGSFAAVGSNSVDSDRVDVLVPNQ
jgi:hypothetical protein